MVENSENLQSQESPSYEQSLLKIANEISQLDKWTDNNDKARENLNAKLDDSFLKSFNDYLRNKGIDSTNDVLIFNFSVSIKGVLEKHKSEPDFSEKYKNIIALAKTLNIQISTESWEVLDQWKKEMPKYPLSESAKTPLDPEDLWKDGEWNDKKTEWVFYEDGKRVESPDWVNSIKQSLWDLKWKLAPLLAENSKYKDNSDLKSINKLIDEFWIIVKNPIESNVQKLQKLIFDNLDNEEEKQDFNKKNKFNSETRQFDWKFWKSTLSWLNKVLSKISEYLNGVEESVKADNNVPTANPDVAPAPVNNPTDDKPEAAPESKPTDVEPAFIGGKYYPVMKNTSELSGKLNFNNAVFFSSNPAVNVDQGQNNWQDVKLDPVESTWLYNKLWERMYYMKYWDSIYQVTIDSNWNLNPIGQNANSKVDVLFKNNKSCINYIVNKLPDAIKGKCNILRNGKDYAIRPIGINHWLTLEPMMLNGNWVSEDVSQCLALLNFTNYLLNNNNIDDLSFKNKHPDLKLDDDWNLQVRINKRDKYNKDKQKWYTINDQVKARFWLNEITNKVFEKFIKYNNGEHWKDDWDKKKWNRHYKQI